MTEKVIRNIIPLDKIPQELGVSLELLPIPSANISVTEKLEYAKFLLSPESISNKLFQLCGGGDIQVAMSRALIKINKRLRKQ